MIGIQVRVYIVLDFLYLQFPPYFHLRKLPFPFCPFNSSDMFYNLLSIPYFSSLYPSDVSPPISRVPLTYVVEIYDDGNIHSFLPSLSKRVDEKVSVQLPELSQNIYEKVFIHANQVQSIEFPLHKVRERHCKEVSKCKGKQDFDYSFEMMTVLFLHELNPAGATANRILATEDGLRVLKEGLNLVILYAWHKHAATEFLCESSEKLGLQAAPGYISSCV